MPCNTVRLTEVKLESSDHEAMFAALQKLKLRPERNNADAPWIIDFGGGRETIDCLTGEATLSQYRDVNEIKRAYSGACVEITAAEFGWDLQSTGNNQFELTARF